MTRVSRGLEWRRVATSRWLATWQLHSQPVQAGALSRDEEVQESGPGGYAELDSDAAGLARGQTAAADVAFGVGEDAASRRGPVDKDRHVRATKAVEDEGRIWGDVGDLLIRERGRRFEHDVESTGRGAVLSFGDVSRPEEVLGLDEARVVGADADFVELEVGDGTVAVVVHVIDDRVPEAAASAVGAVVASEVRLILKRKERAMTILRAAAGREGRVRHRVRVEEGPRVVEWPVRVFRRRVKDTPPNT